MEFIKVESSMIAEIGHQAEPSTLFVRFKNGTLYSYENVPENLYNELMASESKGKFLHERIIKEGFIAKRIEERMWE